MIAVLAASCAVSLIGAAPPQLTPPNAGILIGSEECDAGRLKAPRLVGVAADLAGMKALFRAHFGVAELRELSAETTTSAMGRAAARLSSSADAGTLYLYIFGHGRATQSGVELCLGTRLVSARAIIGAVRESWPQHADVVAFVDACFSGRLALGRFAERTVVLAASYGTAWGWPENWKYKHVRSGGFFTAALVGSFRASRSRGASDPDFDCSGKITAEELAYSLDEALEQDIRLLAATSTTGGAGRIVGDAISPDVAPKAEPAGHWQRVVVYGAKETAITGTRHPPAGCDTVRALRELAPGAASRSLLPELSAEQVRWLRFGAPGTESESEAGSWRLLLYSAPDERAAGIIEESAARMSVTPIQIPEQTSDLETLRTLRLRHWRSLDRSGAREVYVLSHAEGEQRRWAALTDARSGALVAAGWAETPSAGGDPTVYRCSRDLDEEVSTALSFYDCLLDAIPFGGTVSGDAAGGIVSLEPHEHQPARAGWIIEIYRQSTSRGRRAVARAIVAPERRSARLCVPPGSSAPPAVFRGDFYRGFALSEGFSCY